MYNRYIPQPDGSYRRDAVPEPQRQQPQKPPGVSREPEHPPSPPPYVPDPPFHESPRKDGSVGGFLRQLLPKNFDTGDLIIVLLLLLMAGDCEEDRANALLTLALYFIM